MGRNFQGGNKQKSYANKANEKEDQPLRLIQNPDEKYAIVTKVLGGGMFMVNYIDQDQDQDIDQHQHQHIDIDIDIHQQHIKQSIAHIRGAMKGKQKRNHFVTLHSIIIIQIRSFETNAKNSDIIHVYPNHQIQLLPITKILP